MRKVSIPLAIIVFAFLSMGLLLSQENAEDEKFKKVLDTYLDELWKFYPTAATLCGYHNYDNKLEDLSNKNLEKRHGILDKFNQEFVAKVDKFQLSPELQIDHEMVIDALDLELLKHENLVPWEYNPIFYNEIFMNCIRSLLTEEFAPIGTRSKNATERMKNLTKLIKQAKENLKTPPQVFTEAAIKQFPAIMDFYRNELPTLIEQVPEASKPKFQEYLAKVLPALKDYQNFLQGELLSRSTGNFRLGSQAHLRLLRLKMQNSIPIQELIAQAEADYSNIRREMAIVCLPYFRIMYPNLSMEQLTAQRGEEEFRNIAIKGVLDKIKVEHTTKDEFLNDVKTAIGEVKNFLTDNQFVELPQENLTIEPMPLESQGIAWTRLVSPGLYNGSSTFSFQITPFPEDWGEEQTSSFLEEYNKFLIYFWTIREVYPGSFVPLYYTRKYESIVRRLYPNMALIKGWPVSLEEMLIKSGFGNYDLKLRLNQLKLLLRTVLDFQLELNIHQGTMTKEQAIAYMTGRGFQTNAEAERKWEHIILNPGHCAYTYVGYQEILAMEKEYKNIKGDSYNQKEFFTKLLSYGALPLRHLSKKILE
ncbi:MAG: DUF885 domain-containing protein [Candidatus Aminicenantes bacterium]|nr:MAG: DUF885 domain-containing protein [Candidatus Aminicenantes bacterium]